MAKCHPCSARVGFARKRIGAERSEHSFSSETKLRQDPRRGLRKETRTPADVRWMARADRRFSRGDRGKRNPKERCARLPTAPVVGQGNGHVTWRCCASVHTESRPRRLYGAGRHARSGQMRGKGTVLKIALRRYESLRFQRTKHIQKRSLLIGHIGQWQNSMFVTGRDVVTRMLPAKLIERNLRKVYSYET
jgi:hypothetical protein